MDFRETNPLCFYVDRQQNNTKLTDEEIDQVPYPIFFNFFYCCNSCVYDLKANFGGGAKRAEGDRLEQQQVHHHPGVQAHRHQVARLCQQL
jgi:hypothetical protein